MCKDPQERLGSHPRDTDCIRNSKFFEGIDWVKVRNRSMSSNLDLIIDPPDTPRPDAHGPPLQEQLDADVPAYDSPIEEQGIESDCDTSSLWLKDFTQGPLTQQTTGISTS